MDLKRRSALQLSAFAGLSTLAACGRATDLRPAAPGQPRQPRLMFIRHGEEPGSGVSGVAADGGTDPRSLSVRGWTRAGALVNLFDPRDSQGQQTPVRPELARPTKIFAPDPGQTSSRRSLETITPLAAALNLTVDSRFAPTQTAQVADAIRTVSQPLLVARKHEQIAEIISHLDGVTPAPPPWPKGRFDLIYLLDRLGTGWRFTCVPQLLLAGDRPA